MVYIFNLLSSAVLICLICFLALRGLKPCSIEMPTHYMKFCFPSCTSTKNLYLEMAMSSITKMQRLHPNGVFSKLSKHPQQTY